MKVTRRREKRPTAMRLCQNLKVVKQITNANTQRFGDAHQSMDAHRLLATFNLAKVNRVQVSLFGEFLLTYFRSFSVLTNRLTDELLVF